MGMRTPASFLPSVAAVAVAALLLTACKTKTADPVDLGESYIPVAAGTWLQYRVDSIDHNAFTGEVDTFQFQLREVVESSSTDTEGRTAYRIERYKRNDDNAAWGLTDVYSATLTNTGFERFEENVRYLRLSFPPKDGKTWDGNSFNNNAEQEYEYSNVHVGRTVGTHNFDSTLTVVQENNTNLIEIRKAEEHYARNIGLVYKEIIDLDLQDNGGIEYFQTITDWSVN